MASLHIEQQLQATGVAEVIVVVNAVPAAVAAATAPFAFSVTAVAAAAHTLDAHFAVEERSQRASLARVAKQLGRRLTSTGTTVAASRRRDPAEPRIYPHLGVVLGTVTREGLRALEADPAVAAVTGAPPLSLIRPSLIKAARPRRGNTWGIDALKVPDLWASGLTGKGVRVAHLDTGVDGRHPALRAAVKGFAEFDFLGRRVSPDPAAHDSEDHGTHTAGTIAGREVDEARIGVAFEADLFSALVIEGGDVVARVLGGMDWAIEQQVQILSMSLGFRGFWDDFIPVVRILRARNILPVIAVGNEGPGTSRSPGNYPEALSIGAIDNANQVPLFSSSQLFDRADPLVPDLVAPGVDIISAQPGGGFQAMDGSSMATPHVAGLAALLWQAKPGAGAAGIEQAIFDACTLPRGASAERAHRGVPDGAAAFTSLTGLPVTPRRAAAAVGRGSASSRRTAAPKPRGARGTAPAAKRKRAKR